MPCTTVLREGRLRRLAGSASKAAERTRLRQTRTLTPATLAAALLAAAPAGAQTVTAVTAPLDLRSLPIHTGGRALPTPYGAERQWPGTYFETAFVGPAAWFRIGLGEVSLRITVDGGAPIPLIRPAPGAYRVAGLSAGAHRLRIDVATESQAGPTVFGGFFAAPDVRPAAPPQRTRAIEFIGDSHTVGYGNTSPRRDCTRNEIWQTTDTTLGPAALTAKRYNAEYQVNAISGRGIVRNYAGGAGDTLPRAYRFALLDHTHLVTNTGWNPQVIVVGLGTNDFSTPLKPGEKWATRDALHADYEATYGDFLKVLRAEHPRALIVLWATDMAGGEIEAEAARVAEQARAAGDTRIGFVPVNGLAFSACNSHPSLADDARIADALAAYIDQHDAWSTENSR